MDESNRLRLEIALGNKQFSAAELGPEGMALYVERFLAVTRPLFAARAGFDPVRRGMLAQIPHDWDDVTVRGDFEHRTLPHFFHLYRMKEMLNILNSTAGAKQRNRLSYLLVTADGKLVRASYEYNVRDGCVLKPNQTWHGKFIDTEGLTSIFSLPSGRESFAPILDAIAAYAESVRNMNEERLKKTEIAIGELLAIRRRIPLS